MRVPLVVVTGFLGAGKTTLVNRLLANRAARGQLSMTTGKLGVIVNELGEVGIDGALLGSDATKQIELPGGCVCCVLGPELDQTLLELVRTNPDLEAIVLETTGVAEPLPIAWAVRRDPVAQHVRLAAVVTLIDAANFRASQTVSVSVNSQVAYADVLLVTKESIAGPAETELAIATAQELSPRAIVRRGSTTDHAAWLEQVLADPAIERVETERFNGPDRPHPAHDPGHVHDETCRDADSHAHGVDSTYLDVEAPLDLEELEDQLSELPPNYVRIKGIVRSADGRWTVVHRVGVRVSTEPFERKPEGMLGQNGRIVALGTNLSSEKLAECLKAAYAS